MVLTFVALSSCDKTIEATQYHFPIIELNQCNDTTINSQNIQICFDSLLTDSRCPINAVCVWAGEASVKLSLHTQGIQQSFRLSTFTNPPAFRNDTIISGYKIKLLDVTPYPGDNSHTPYKVELSVTR